MERHERHEPAARVGESARLNKMLRSCCGHLFERLCQRLRAAVIHLGVEMRRGGLPFTINHHGSENVFTKLKCFIASMTPSLMPRPLSLMPPNGEFSMRKPGISLMFTVPQRSCFTAFSECSR